MAIKFIDPGGDATFDFKLYTGVGTGTVSTDYLHGNHVKSYKWTNSQGYAYKSAVVADAGGRISAYFYFTDWPASANGFVGIEQTADGLVVAKLQISTTGVLQAFERGGNQIGSNGTTLSLNTWYRISFAWTITSKTVNEFRVYLNGVLDITGTNVSLQNNTATDFIFGSFTGDASFTMYASEIFIDDINSLADTGDVRVTAKRPFGNGTAVQFTTQIGSGNSGYGDGHADEVNERALSETNGWSLSITTTKKTEEYNIEGLAVGDINLTGTSILGFMGWIWAKVASTTNRVTNIIVNNVATAKLLTTSYAMWTQITNTSIYPSGTGTDIGMDAVFSTTPRLASLAECGIIVAYINYPKASTLTDNFDDNSLDTTKWYDNSTPGTVAETGGQLVITPPASTVYVGDVYTASPTWANYIYYDLISSAVFVNVKQICTGGVITQLDVSLYAGTDWLYIKTDGTNIVTGSFAGDRTSVAYNASTMKWWQIRESGGTTYWEYSATGVPGSWTTLDSVANLFTLTAVYLELIVWDLGAAATPGAAIFDNFNVAGVASGTNMQINIGDVWKTVTGLQINIGDVWKTVTNAQINIGDVWKTIF